MKTILFSILFILSAYAQEDTLKGSFGSSCVDTFKGLQCESMLEVSYDETQVSIKTFGLTEGRNVNEYKGHNPNHEIYWVVADKHLIISKRYIQQQQQQQQQCQQCQQCQQDQGISTSQQCEEFQRSCRQQYYLCMAQQEANRREPSTIECQKVTELRLLEDSEGLLYTSNTYCDNGYASNSSREYKNLSRIR